jgi:hypothetical protein
MLDAAPLIFTDTNDVQFCNTLPPNVVTVDGKVKLVNAVPLKQYALIVVICDGTVNEAREEHP